MPLNVRVQGPEIDTLLVFVLLRLVLPNYAVLSDTFCLSQSRKDTNVQRSAASVVRDI